MKTLTKGSKILIGIGIAVLLLIITNPSQSSFKTYLGANSYEGLKRPVNLFVASIYKEGSRKYLGVFGNFVWINPPSAKQIAAYKKQAELDSLRMARDSSMISDTSNHDALPRLPKGYTLTK